VFVFALALFEMSKKKRVIPILYRLDHHHHHQIFFFVSFFVSLCPLLGKFSSVLHGWVHCALFFWMCLSESLTPFYSSHLGGFFFVLLLVLPVLPVLLTGVVARFLPFFFSISCLSCVTRVSFNGLDHQKHFPVSIH
jgi:hypothetical protein